MSTPIYDKYGSLEDNPLIRLAREYQDNMANAEESAAAMQRNNVFREYFNIPGGGEDPSTGEATDAVGSRLSTHGFTPQYIQETLFDPLNARYPQFSGGGIHRGSAYEIRSTPGGGSVAIDRNTGKIVRTLVEGTTKPPVDTMRVGKGDSMWTKDHLTGEWKLAYSPTEPPDKENYQVPVEFDGDGMATKYHSFTKNQLRDAYATLPEQSKTNNAVVRALTGDGIIEKPVVPSGYWGNPLAGGLGSDPFSTGLRMGGFGAPTQSISPDIQSASPQSQPNVTQAEYARLRPGETYWWNGTQLTKK